MHICLIGNAANIHEQRWMQPLAQAGHRISIISPLPATLSYAHVIVYDPETAHADRATRVFGTIIDIRRILKGLAPDIVNIHFISGIALLSPFLGHRNIVLTAWGSDVLVFPKKSLLRRMLVRFCLKHAALATGNSQALVQALCDVGGIPAERTAVIRWSIDQDAFPFVHEEQRQEQRARLGIQPGEFVFMHFRNITPVYNIETVINAFARIAKKYPESRLFIKYETETGLDTVKDMITRAGIAGQTLLHGIVPHQELHLFLAAADVGLSVSSSDGFPVSVLEAMASRLPLILSDIPANREMIDRTGRATFVPPKDVTALAEAMEGFLKKKVPVHEYVAANLQQLTAIGDNTTNIQKILPLFQRLLDTPVHNKRTRA